MVLCPKVATHFHCRVVFINGIQRVITLLRATAVVRGASVTHEPHRLFSSNVLNGFRAVGLAINLAFLNSTFFITVLSTVA